VTRTLGTKEFWLSALRADGAAFNAAAGEPGVLGAPVPSCPGWSVGDLVRHLGAVYRRTRTRSTGDNAREPWGAVVIPDDAPSAGDRAMLTWFADELAELDAALEALDPDHPVWNWAPQPKTMGFWHRRMAHETALHRWDVQQATRLPEPIEAKLAADTVAEALDTFLPAGRRKTTADVEGMIRLVATDVGQDWFVRLRGLGVAVLDTGTLFDDDAHPTRTFASGTASDVALAIWGRVAFDVLDVEGDPTLLDALQVT
jgi:uncharacterized protein (TIGR03083 family)